MTAFSLGTIWEETIAFVRKESAVLVPVALAIFGPSQLLLAYGMSGTATMRTAAGAISRGEMLLVLSAALLLLFGNISVSLMVLVPGISVGEALSSAIRRMSKAIGAILLLSGGFIALGLIIVIVVTTVGLVVHADPRSRAVSDYAAVLILVPTFLLLVRMLPLLPALATEQAGPMEIIRRVWALGRNNLIRFVGVWVLAMFLGLIVALIEFVIGSVVQLLRLAIGNAELLTVVEMLVNAALGALLSLGMAVYLALVYRKLSGAGFRSPFE